MSVNDQTINDTFSFADDLHEMIIDEQDSYVSYDVSSLFTNVPVDETIEILAEKAFKDDWFNKEYDLNITKTDLIELLEIASKSQQSYLFTVSFLFMPQFFVYCFYVNILEFTQYPISIFKIDCIYLSAYKILPFNLKMTVEQSQRRCFSTFTYIVRSVSKNLIRIWISKAKI